MSGRSAYVRKEKTKIKDDKTTSDVTSNKSKSSTIQPSLSDFPMPGGHDYGAPAKKPQAESVVSGGSGEKRLDDSAYARVRKPVIPSLDVSGIEKSSFRSLMDKKSEGIRKGLSGFGKKKKNTEQQPRPETAATIRPSPESFELDGSSALEPPPPRPRPQTGRSPDTYPSPPSGKLPPIPAVPQLKRYTGSGRPVQPWNKLRKDPELWDRHGDTLIFLAHETHEAARPPPSFRISSHVLEQTESRFFANILREGCTEFNSDVEGASPISPQSRGRSKTGFPSPQSISEDGSEDPNGQISYELYFPAPINQSKIDSLRYHVTTRNVFALLYRASLVGLSLFQALEDLLERMQQYMPTQTDNAGVIIDYVTSKGIDDARNDPSAAVSLLLWSELRNVRWQEGWREFFVHCAGMHTRIDSVPESRFVSPITKALLERASLEGAVRVQDIENRFVDFNFGDMWPAMSPVPPPERASFERLRHFLRGYYEASCGSWPVLPPPNSEQWLTRDLTKRLQKDFGALYDYLVDRDVTWDCSEERSSRKWKIVRSKSDVIMNADTPDLPMTDILVAFDNRHRYPHIPHPYPLVPDSMPANPTSPSNSNENLFKISKKSNKPTTSVQEDKMIERRIALAYTEATNIYLLGSDFVHNRLVDAFVQFEKADKPSEVDPFAARRGRWVLIYGILQVLASISVDTPGIRYKDGVGYHLNPRLRGTPPWKTTNRLDEATHEGSHCWLSPKAWAAPAEMDVPMLDGMSVSTSPMVSPSRRIALLNSSSVRSSAAPSTVGTESDAGSERLPSSRGTSGRGTNERAYARRGRTGAGGEGNDLETLSLGSGITGGGIPGFSPNSGFSNIAREHHERHRDRERETQRDIDRDLSSGRDGRTGSERHNDFKAINNGIAGMNLRGGTGGISYGPGIQKVEEWPIRDDGVGMINGLDVGSRGRDGLIIKDFDDYNF